MARLTPAQQKALGKLTVNWARARVIGVNAQTLNALVRHGLVEVKSEPRNGVYREELHTLYRLKLGDNNEG